MSETLSATERRVYEYLIDFLAEHTYQPSIREIGKQFRIKSTKTVSDILHSLARKGYIERDPSRSRGVRLVGYTGVGGTQAVPYFGKIHAGEPALIPAHRVGHLVLDRRLAPTETSFLLRVMGHSMIGRGIHDGDYVVVDPTNRPTDGSIVAARVGAEATIKTLTHRDGHTVLVPAHPDERELVVYPGDDVAILGTVATVLRSLSGGADPLSKGLHAESQAPTQMS